MADKPTALGGVNIIIIIVVIIITPIAIIIILLKYKLLNCSLSFSLFSAFHIALHPFTPIRSHPTLGLVLLEVSSCLKELFFFLHFLGRMQEVRNEVGEGDESGQV